MWGAGGPVGFPGLSEPLQQTLGGTGRGRGLSGWEAVGTESSLRESRGGKTPGHLGWGKVQNIHAGGEGRLGVALKALTGSSGLREQGAWLGKGWRRGAAPERSWLTPAGVDRDTEAERRMVCSRQRPERT